jgi:hypothetical protein
VQHLRLSRTSAARRWSGRLIPSRRVCTIFSQYLRGLQTAILTPREGITAWPKHPGRTTKTGPIMAEAGLVSFLWR